MEKLSKATVGESYYIRFTEDPFHSELSKEHQKKGLIAESCGKNTPLGRWACLTHQVHFGNQMNKDGHIHTGKHTLAWWCPECCTYEVP